MSIVIKNLDKKTLIRNIIKIINISKISNWTFKNFILNLPGKWDKSLAVFDENKKQFIAYSILSENSKNVHIHLLMVSQKYQGRGVGSKILRKISDHTNKNITVKTYTNLINTIKFYKKNGFLIKYLNKQVVFLERKKLFLSKTPRIK